MDQFPLLFRPAPRVVLTGPFQRSPGLVTASTISGSGACFLLHVVHFHQHTSLYHQSDTHALGVLHQEKRHEIGTQEKKLKKIKILQLNQPRNTRRSDVLSPFCFVSLFSL